MGWICTGCRTENAFDIAVCQACRARITRKNLGKEKSRAAAEHRAFTAQLRRQNAPVSDYRKLRKALPRINAAMMLLLLVLTVWAVADLPHGEDILPYTRFTPEAALHGVDALSSRTQQLCARSATSLNRLVTRLSSSLNASSQFASLPSRFAVLANAGLDGVNLLALHASVLAGRGISRPYGQLLDEAVQSVRAAASSLAPRAIDMLHAFADGFSYLINRLPLLIRQLFHQP